MLTRGARTRTAPAEVSIRERLMRARERHLAAFGQA
jgi:hypothetical protein